MEVEGRGWGLRLPSFKPVCGKKNSYPGHNIYNNRKIYPETSNLHACSSNETLSIDTKARDLVTLTFVLN